jgi:hypothetical protein
MEGIKGFPRVYEYVEEERFSYLVMEKLELTLDVLGPFFRDMQPGSTPTVSCQRQSYYS